MLPSSTATIEKLDDKLAALRIRVRDLGKAVIAFSGGVDSSLMLKVAVEELGAGAVGVLAVSASLPQSERAEAIALAGSISADLECIETSETDDTSYQANAPNRCFYCKDFVYAALRHFADARGILHVVDGMNAEDTLDVRPGRAAALKHGVRSPLNELEFSKAEVREAAKILGLPNWDKPAAACLSSRIPYGTKVTTDLLARVEAAESFVRSMGFCELRVRHHGDVARVEVPVANFQSVMAKHDALVGGLKALGWLYITLDLEGLRQGSMNEVLTPK